MALRGREGGEYEKLAKSPRQFNLKIPAFKHVLEFGCKVKKGGVGVEGYLFANNFRFQQFSSFTWQ